ncbi:ABC transporter ATP-binding protein [Clostridium sp. OS1-26]|uniref:ABC transporter ATP-binding protein n=1 Tax=Clostridium sp. OS1-26 TaxID=3070681 RepID=UPI0027DF931B|nr:ABC transporter ATP-binding protein [Clostridium sp. OS1-26]WML36754.1 ABC transporter ATP-binding protein [Clostridium sp. OS1-26]
MSVIIDVKNVSMSFNMSKERIESLKEYFIKMAKGQLHFTEFVALNDVSFSVNKGETVGIVGLNGSGKSTILKIISGIMKPTKGSVSVSGTIAPLIELGAGFDMELTARENVFLNGYVLGYSKKQIEDKFDEIIEFSELGEFTDVAVKNFSSGMYARLGFSIATAINPEILIVDEILGVGDFLFQEKCEKRIKEMMSKNTTVLLVSHNIDKVKKMCSKVVWLEKGKLRMFGDTDEVCAAYQSAERH